MHVFLFKNLFLLSAILHLSFRDALFLLAKTFFYFLPEFFSIFCLSDNDIHDVSVCVHLDECCSISYNISVKKCDTGKYVYQLANPEACDMAYCAGSGIPCEVGKVWVEENNQCEGGCPHFQDTN